MRDDGIVFICDLTDIAQRGEMPKETLTKVSKHYFENRTIGISRSYMAKGVNEQVDKVIRIELNNNVRIGQIAMLGNGEQFRINQVSSGQDVNPRTKLVDSKYYRTPEIVDMPYTELTLSRLNNYYDVLEN